MAFVHDLLRMMSSMIVSGSKRSMSLLSSYSLKLALSSSSFQGFESGLLSFGLLQISFCSGLLFSSSSFGNDVLIGSGFRFCFYQSISFESISDCSLLSSYDLSLFSLRLDSLSSSFFVLLQFAGAQVLDFGATFEGESTAAETLRVDFFSWGLRFDSVGFEITDQFIFEFSFASSLQPLRTLVSEGFVQSNVFYAQLQLGGASLITELALLFC